MATDEDRKEPGMDNATDDGNAEMSLRDHLLAAHAAASQHTSQSPPNQQQPHQAPPEQQSDHQQPNGHTHQEPSAPQQVPQGQPPTYHHHPDSPQQHHPHHQYQPHEQSSSQYPGQLDPQIAAHAAHAAQYGYAPHPQSQGHPGMSGDLSPESAAQQQAAMDGLSPPPPGMSAASAKARRELSNSKRAAQNRAAQRAFRQRKETYIKKLEDDVRNASALPALQENFQRVQQENFDMRNYIMSLQSKLIDLTGEFPHPPAGLELRDPRSGEVIGTQPVEGVGTAAEGEAAPVAMMGYAAVDGGGGREKEG